MSRCLDLLPAFSLQMLSRGALWKPKNKKRLWCPWSAVWVCISVFRHILEQGEKTKSPIPSLSMHKAVLNWTCICLLIVIPWHWLFALILHLVSNLPSPGDFSSVWDPLSQTPDICLTLPFLPQWNQRFQIHSNVPHPHNAFEGCRTCYRQIEN